MSASAPWMDPLYLSRPVHNLLSRRGPRARLQILIYHRVLDRPDPLQRSEPTVEEFRWQMALLARHFNVLSLSGAVDGLERGTLPPRAVCITFDDGYADNATLALPVLRELDLPATVFVAPGYLDGGIMFNDAVRCCVEQARTPELKLEAIGMPALRLATPDQCRESLRTLLGALKYLPSTERREKTDALVQLTGAVLPTDLMMSSQLLLEAARGFDIGAHTVTHPILKNLESDQARREIADSRDILAEKLGRPVELFAYPNGVPGVDYSSRDVKLADALGFKAAVSTRPGYSTVQTNRFELRRFTPWDKRPARFLARLLKNYSSS